MVAWRKTYSVGFGWWQHRRRLLLANMSVFQSRCRGRCPLNNRNCTSVLHLRTNKKRKYHHKFNKYHHKKLVWSNSKQGRKYTKVANQNVPTFSLSYTWAGLSNAKWVCKEKIIYSLCKYSNFWIALEVQMFGLEDGHAKFWCNNLILILLICGKKTNPFVLNVTHYYP